MIVTGSGYLPAREAAVWISRAYHRREMNPEWFDPVEATGLLTSRDGQTFLGTLTAFRTGRHFLTAAHCVGGLSPEEVAVYGPRIGVFPVTRLTRHVTADLVLVEIEEDLERLTPFSGSVGSDLGEEFFAFGYPENALSAEDSRVPRLFAGNYQRFFDHRDLDGHNYLAGEMSIPAPRGLSGGPLFLRKAPEILTGIVTANFDSATALEAHEEEATPGHKREVRYQRVISYGLALMLDSVDPWLEELVPRELHQRRREAIRTKREEQLGGI